MREEEEWVDREEREVVENERGKRGRVRKRSRMRKEKVKERMGVRMA